MPPFNIEKYEQRYTSLEEVIPDIRFPVHEKIENEYGKDLFWCVFISIIFGVVIYKLLHLC